MVEGAQRGVAAKCPKSFHNPDLPLRCSQLITGNPYNTQRAILNRHHIRIIFQYTINRTIAGGWHTEIHHSQARHHHESRSRLFSGFFYEAVVVQYVTYLTAFCRVSRVVYPSWGTTPRDFPFSGTGAVGQRCAATCQITRKDGAIIDMLYI